MLWSALTEFAPWSLSGVPSILHSQNAGKRARGPLRERRVGINVVRPVDELVVEVDAGQAGGFAGQPEIGGLHRRGLPAAGFHRLFVVGAVEADVAHVERLAGAWRAAPALPSQAWRKG